MSHLPRPSVTCLVLCALACFPSWAAAQTLEQKLLSEPISTLAADARRAGDPARGAAIFYARSLACSTCHSVGDRPSAIGPDLAKLDAKVTDAALVEAVLEPSKTIAAAYATVSLLMTDGRVINGLPVEEDAERIILRDLVQTEQLITVRKTDIEQRNQKQQSIMPSGQMNQLANRQQFLDLIRYLIDLRAGGPKRARELQPAPSGLVQEIPDRPLPWRPVVQRGEVAVGGNQKYPHAVAIGFAGGTLLFDADRLGLAAWWNDGFVKHSPQNYFGLYWHRDGGAPEQMTLSPHPLQFQLSANQDWQPFEPAAVSDPNVGTRFLGYQIGKTSVRLQYRCLVGGKLIHVSEDVRAESRPQWQGYVREFRFTGLPAGARVSLAVPSSSAFAFHSVKGEKITAAENISSAPFVSFERDKKAQVVRAHAAGATWENKSADCRLISAGASAEPLLMRIDHWKYSGSQVSPSPAELVSLVETAPVLDDRFDAPIKASAPLPEVTDADLVKPMVASRPGVNPRENIDEFSPTVGRFLRFVVTRTNDGSEPGLDELEVYGPESKDNLALAGKSTASTVIKGYAIHQIPHLNDGKLGNNHSWISAEKNGGWAQVEFAEPVKVNRIVWARDRTGTCRDRLAVAYRIEVSDDGKSWVKVGDESGRAASENPVGTVRRDAAKGYIMEAIPTPFPACRPSDIVFSNDGSMYAIAMTEGQIWRTRTPPADHPERVKWERYAAGLYHPIGLAIVDGRLYVAQKQEITELIDRDGDGRVEHYRTVATGWGLSTGWHEYCFGLAVDPDKNLWFALNTGYFWTNPGYVNPGRWRGSVMRVAHGTEKIEIMATGCRVPNGIAQGPEGGIYFTDNQGDWIQACKVAHVVPGRFYGHPETKADALPKDVYPTGRSAIWLPYDRCRSVSGPVHDITGGKFGPFADQLFVGDVGYGANAGIMRIALEKVNGEYQGACFRFIEGQPLGCERMRFGPENQLYMASLSTGLTRVAYDGKTPAAVHSLRIRLRGKGFVVHLTKALDDNVKLAPEQFKIRRYHYLYTGQYGSPQADETNVPVEAVELSTDRTQFTLSFPVETYPIGMVYAFHFGDLNFAGGERLEHKEAWYTVHQIPE